MTRLARLAPMVRQVDSSARSLDSGETDVDGGVEDGAPQDVGDCQPGHLEAVRHPGQTGLEDQEGGNGHRAAHPLEPRAELAVLGGLAAVHDLTHGDIGKGVHDAGRHHHDAHHTGGNAHHVGVEFHQEQGREDEGEVVAKVTEHIAQLVLHAEGTQGTLAFRCHKNLLFFFAFALPRRPCGAEVSMCLSCIYHTGFAAEGVRRFSR